MTLTELINEVELIHTYVRKDEDSKTAVAMANELVEQWVSDNPLALKDMRWYGNSAAFLMCDMATRANVPAKLIRKLELGQLGKAPTARVLRALKAYASL